VTKTSAKSANVNNSTGAASLWRGIEALNSPALLRNEQLTNYAPRLIDKLPGLPRSQRAMNPHERVIGMPES
jgi:hypothetical protein